MQVFQTLMALSFSLPTYQNFKERNKVSGFQLNIVEQEEGFRLRR